MKFQYDGETLEIVERVYVEGGRIRLDIVDEQGCPYAVLTKNDIDCPLADGEFLVKTYAENENIAAAVKHLFTDTGRRLPTGYVQLEIWSRNEQG